MSEMDWFLIYTGWAKSRFTVIELFLKSRFTAKRLQDLFF